MAPKITCICPTGNREEYLPLAVQCFLAQTFTDAELLIMDDGARPNPDFCDAVYDGRGIGESHFGRIRYLWEPRMTLKPPVSRMSIGTKRNYLCELAKGEIIAHWDDDDWYAPERLEIQLEQLQKSRKPFVGHHSITYWDMETNSAFKFVQAKYDRPYACGTSMMYLREYGRQVTFQNLKKAEDSTFSEHGRARGYLASFEGTQLVVARAHADSTCAQSADKHPCFPSVSIDEVPDRFLLDIGYGDWL